MEVNVLLDMLLSWWERQRETMGRRRGPRAVVWEEEMEMYGKSDRCKRWERKGR